MLNLVSNMQTIEYALYTGMQDGTTPGGKRTGEPVKVYTPPQKYRIYVSPSKGEAAIEPFGQSEDYTNVMSTANMNCPIDENSILWIGISSKNGAKHNYRVTRVARGKGSILYAIEKVSVS